MNTPKRLLLLASLLATACAPTGDTWSLRAVDWSDGDCLAVQRRLIPTGEVEFEPADDGVGLILRTSAGETYCELVRQVYLCDPIPLLTLGGEAVGAGDDVAVTTEIAYGVVLDEPSRVVLDLTLSTSCDGEGCADLYSSEAGSEIFECASFGTQRAVRADR